VKFFNKYKILKEKMTQNGIVLVVSISVFKDDKVLIIKENKPPAIEWNFPSGRIEYGELSKYN